VQQGELWNQLPAVQPDVRWVLLPVLLPGEQQVPPNEPQVQPGELLALPRVALSDEPASQVVLQACSPDEP
jgi:hypothetical protein